MAGEDKLSRHGVHEIDSARLAAFELVTQWAVPGAAAALARLHVFEVLAGAGDGAQLTAAEIAAKAIPGKAINVTYLERLLRLMSVSRILSETTVKVGDGQAERRYGLAPIGRFLVEDAAAGSLVPFLHLGQAPQMLSLWDHLDAVILDDTPVSSFARAQGGLSLWDYCQRNPEFGELVNQGMAGHSRLYLGAILKVYRGFDEVKVLVDVGGGLGASLEQITRRHPHIKGVNFDQAHVTETCPEIPGVEFMSGDFFESVPAVGDAILMKNILHDWNDEKCLRILHNCYQALPGHGKLILVDSVLSESSAFEAGDGAAFALDLIMLGNFGSDARERTEGELRTLATGAGFAQVVVVCKVDHVAVLECRKLVSP